MASVADHLQIKTGKPSHYGPGDAGDVANHGAEFASKTATGRKLNFTDDAVAVPFRAELARLIDINNGGDIDTTQAALGDIILARNTRTGEQKFVVAQSNGGLDANGIPTADLDFIKGIYDELGFRGERGEMEYTVVASLNSPREISDEQRIENAAQLQNLVDLTAKNGRIPIHRRTESNAVPAKDWSTFETTVAGMRKDLYLPSNYKIEQALSIVEKANRGEGNISDLTPMLGVVYKPEMLAEGVEVAAVTFSKDAPINRPIVGNPDNATSEMSGVDPAQQARDGQMVALERELAERNAKRQAFDNDPNVTPAQRQAEQTRRQQEDESLMGYMQKLMQEDPLMALVFAIVMVAFGIENDFTQGVFNSVADTRSGSHSRGGGSYGSSSARHSGGALANFDLSNVPTGESTLIAASGSQLRDILKGQYVAGLDPYLYKGDLKDIPPGSKVVVLDPGHIGRGLDLGASATIGGKTISEAGSCLPATIAQAKEFHEAGVVVLSTIQTQAFLDNTLTPYARRIYMENADAAAKAVGGEMIAAISNHYNDSDNKSANGVEILVNNPNSKTASTVLGEAALASLTGSGMFRSDRGMKSEYESQHSEGIAVVSDKFNSLLIEFGFQRGDTQVLASSKAMAELGRGTARSILEEGNKQYAWNLELAPTEEQLAQAAAEEVKTAELEVAAQQYKESQEAPPKLAMAPEGFIGPYGTNKGDEGYIEPTEAVKAAGARFMGAEAKVKTEADEPIVVPPAQLEKVVQPSLDGEKPKDSAPVSLG